MYQPEHFVETRREVMAALIERHPFGLLVSVDGGRAVANGLPFLLDWNGNGTARLLAHMARANDHWRAIADGSQALVVFQGEQAYVTPSWYATKAETGKVVPTWNYCMVQVRGPVRIHHDAAWLGQQIRALTDRHEASFERPWSVDDAPERYIEAQMRGIVGIEVEIAEIHGKWKVSQNRGEADRQGVARGLAAAGNAGPIAEIVAAYLRSGETG